MGEGSRENFDVPPEMRSMAEASVEQARKAFENFLTAAQRTASAFEGQGNAARTGARDISAKAIAYAEQNVAASLDYAQKLVRAKDLPEVMRLHTEYVQGQMRALAQQASEMGQTMAKAAMDVGKPK